MAKMLKKKFNKSFLCAAGVVKEDTKTHFSSTTIQTNRNNE